MTLAGMKKRGDGFVIGFLAWAVDEAVAYFSRSKLALVVPAAGTSNVSFVLML